VLRTLSGLQARLEHILLALIDQRDDDGTLLRHEARALLGTVSLMLDSATGVEEQFGIVVARGVSIVERVREYAEREGVYLGPGTMSETLVMSPEEVKRALSASMRPGDTEPPRDIVAMIEDAQDVGGEEFPTAPPSRETMPDPEERG
jgi:hypothetical protein